MAVLIIGSSLSGLGCGIISIITQLMCSLLVDTAAISRFEHSLSLMFCLEAAVGSVLNGILIRIVARACVYRIGGPIASSALLASPFILYLPSSERQAWYDLFLDIHLIGWLPFSVPSRSLYRHNSPRSHFCWNHLLNATLSHSFI